MEVYIFVSVLLSAILINAALKYRKEKQKLYDMYELPDGIYHLERIVFCDQQKKTYHLIAINDKKREFKIACIAGNLPPQDFAVRRGKMFSNSFQNPEYSF